jgi:copper oxidase (laccase) domain-containing protein
MVQYGCHELRAIVGPHISASEYEFGTEDLAQMVKLIGERAASWTKDGLPALDLRAAVEETLSRSSVIIDHQVARCTAEDPRYWSHRANGDDQRFALVAEIRLL